MDHAWLLSGNSFPKNELSTQGAVNPPILSKSLHPTPKSLLFHSIQRKRVPSSVNSVSALTSLRPQASASSSFTQQLQSPASKRATDHRIAYFQLLHLHVYHGCAHLVPSIDFILIIFILFDSRAGALYFSGNRT
jgi:hypothetical protein